RSPLRPRSTVPPAPRVAPRARIVFDPEEPRATPPIFNTVDSGVPTSQVAALPPTQPGTQFTVRWSGSDDAGGSALASFTIFVSENGGAFTPWLRDTTLPQATFTGQLGK